MLFVFVFVFIIYIIHIQQQKTILLQQIQELKNTSAQPIQYTQPIQNTQPIQGIPINIPTRGVSEYTQVGILSNIEDSNILLPLFGRKTFNRSSKNNYHTSSNGYHKLDLALSYKNVDCTNEYGCNELFTDDIVLVTGYSSNFKVTIYKTTGPTYIPIIT
jgi:hypothetical protein